MSVVPCAHHSDRPTSEGVAGELRQLWGDYIARLYRVFYSTAGNRYQVAMVAGADAQLPPLKNTSGNTGTEK